MALPPLTGVERIRIMQFLRFVKKENPRWSPDDVNGAVALARLGRGPYKEHWVRMNATGLSQKDADAAAPQP